MSHSPTPHSCQKQSIIKYFFQHFPNLHWIREDSSILSVEVRENILRLHVDLLELLTEWSERIKKNHEIDIKKHWFLRIVQSILHVEEKIFCYDIRWEGYVLDHMPYLFKLFVVARMASNAWPSNEIWPWWECSCSRDHSSMRNK